MTKCRAAKLGSSETNRSHSSSMATRNSATRSHAVTATSCSRMHRASNAITNTSRGRSRGPEAHTRSRPYSRRHHGCRLRLCHKHHHSRHRSHEHPCLVSMAEHRKQRHIPGIQLLVVGPCRPLDRTLLPGMPRTVRELLHHPLRHNNTHPLHAHVGGQELRLTASGSTGGDNHRGTINSWCEYNWRSGRPLCLGLLLRSHFHNLYLP